MPLPTITHLQYAVLCCMSTAQVAGKSIRDRIAELGVTMSLPGFYQLMARLEADGLVKGTYKQTMIGNQPIKERWYKLTRRGSTALANTFTFYESDVRP